MEWANYRLYLNAVKISSCDLSESIAYTFSYYDRDTNGKDGLPNRMSMAQDHWGYYNGKNSNSTLRPAYDGASGGGSVAGANRDASFPSMRAGTLESIKYPTGGKTVYTYEAHSAGETIGGLRIAQIADYESEEIVKKKTYLYYAPSVAGRPNYTSGGDRLYYNGQQLHREPYPTCGTATPDADCYSYLRLTSGHPIAMGSTNGYHISYGMVKVVEEGNGSREYHYTTANNFPDGYKNGFSRYSYRDIDEPGVSPFPTGTGSGSWTTSLGWPFAPKIDYSWKRGILLIEKVFKEGENDPIRTTTNTYDYNALKEINGLVWIRTPFVFDNGRELQTENNYYYGDYSIILGAPRLQTQTITEDGLTRTISYEYDESDFLSKVSETSSDEKSIETLYYYAESPEFANSTTLGSNLLRNAHILSPALKTIKKVNNAEIFKQEKEYTLHNDQVVLTTISKYPNGNSNNKRVQEIEYDNLIRPISVINFDGIQYN